MRDYQWGTPQPIAGILAHIVLRCFWSNQDILIDCCITRGVALVKPDETLICLRLPRLHNSLIF